MQQWTEPFAPQLLDRIELDQRRRNEQAVRRDRDRLQPALLNLAPVAHQAIIRRAIDDRAELTRRVVGRADVDASAGVDEPRDKRFIRRSYDRHA